jgi:pimeloyl-ACP methyl ester carboxylesterase
MGFLHVSSRRLEIPYVHPSGQPLYYAAHRSREREPLPIVLIHGAGGNHLFWPPALRRLSPWAATYLPDLPGHGRSAGPGFNSVEAFADVVQQMCHLLYLTNVVVIGHSMGGAVALAIALRWPDLCHSLVLLNSAAKFDVPRAILHALAEERERAIELIIEHAFSPEFSDDSMSAPGPVVEAARRMMLELPLTTLRDDYLACHEFDVTDQLDHIEVPTLIVCATGDALTPLRDQYALAEQIPGSRLALIANAGHAAPLTHAQEVRREILAFTGLTRRS